METGSIRLLFVIYIVYLLLKITFGYVWTMLEGSLALGALGYALSLWIPRKGQCFWNQDGPMLKLRTWICYFHLWLNPFETDKLARPSLDGATLEEMGILPSKHELKLEQTRPHESLDQGYEDSVEFWARNEDGSILAIKVGLRADRRAEAWFSWKEGAGGQIYELAQGTSYKNVETSSPNSYKAGGLNLTVLEPFRRWRIIFNGILRRADGTLFHCKLNAIWAAIDRPIQNKQEGDPWILAQAAAALKLDTVSSIVSLRQRVLSGIDQYGSVRGIMSISNESDETVKEVEIQVGGLKTKDYAPYSVKQRVTLQGSTETGFGFSITVQSMEGITITTGHLLIPGTTVVHIDEFEEPDVRYLQAALQRDDFEPKSMFIRFKADARWFNVGITFIPNPFVQNQNGSTLVHAMDITFNCVRGRGMAVFHSPISDVASDEPNNESVVPLLVPNPIDINLQEIPVIATLRSDICGHTSICGGKGASLGLMLQGDPASWGENVHVPDGLCVTTEGWRAQLHENPRWKDKIQDIAACLVQEQFDEKVLSQLQVHCDELHELIKNGRVTENVTSAICQGLKSIFGDDWTSGRRFAVRSSALGEDSEDLSAAGQNDTVLGCRGRDAIEKALLQCWGSLYSFQSIQYRRQNSQPIETPMGVVIQEMVEADAAGVMFSRDPTTGNPSHIVITANYGLGESVVSSISEPDTIRVSYHPWEKDLSNQFKVHGIDIGSKHSKIVMVQEGETCESSVSEAESKIACLKTEIVLKLARLAIKIEDRFGGPRDIEFAVKGDNIFLLQSRPITSLLTWTDYELLHEFDCGALSRSDVLTKANVGEVLPGALTVLTSSILTKVMDLVIQNSQSSSMGSKMSYSPYLMRFTLISHQQVFFNYLDGCLPTIVEPKKNIGHKALDVSVFGHEVTTQRYVDMAIDRRGILTKMENFKMGLSLGKNLLKSMLHKTFPSLGSYEFWPALVNISEDMTPMEAFVEFQKVLLGPMPAATKNHIDVSQNSTLFQLILFMTLTDNSSEWTMDTYSDATSLLVCDDVEVESAGVPKDLRSLSQAIAQNAHAKDFVDCSDTQDAEKWMRSNEDPQIGVAFEQILSKFHCRCLREFELNVQPWGEDCTPLVRTIKAMVEQNLEAKVVKNVSAHTPKKSLDQKLDDLSQKLSPKARRVLKFIVPYANGSQASREKCKAVLIRHVHETRKASRQLARILRQKGFLPNESLIFHLTLYEIQDLVATRSPGLIQKAIRREKLFPLWNENQFPEINEGPPIPGDILVTVSTDIGWSPYFPLLGGVVTELGGLISHGAVVAREYGLPCIVGAQGATKAFQSGNQLEIDASVGVISKLTEQGSTSTT
eukprot:TCALIF_11579-PA protein Name:"Similar to pps Putative phosphoenolpyruvate synthase (Bacillus subtilis (strain 168))" AED:0.06 eAED:0.06 QI:16/0.95/0.88/1/0.54/0.68/25/119/1347